MIGAQSAYAETAFQSGYKHGLADGKLVTAGIDRDYIHQQGQGFANHTTAFIDGYIKGWCSTADIGGHGAGGIEPNDDGPTVASFDCDRGLKSAFPHPVNWPTLAYANQADTKQETGANTMPAGSRADDGTDVSGYPLLPPGQHYDTCEPDNKGELGCTVANSTGGGV
jgi:hypothetical protein